MSETHVKKWQEVIGVNPDGNFGPLTLEASLKMAEKVRINLNQAEKPSMTPNKNPYAMIVPRLTKNGDYVEWKPTPNLSPGIITPRLIVIHYTGSNSDQSALNWLTQKGSNVSCHFLITKTGKVCQMAHTDRRAWHAGKSYYARKGLQTSDVNGCSIGIENTGLGDEWPEAQIVTNIQICQALIQSYPIMDIVGHNFVAIPAGRKLDPGLMYPWSRVLKECGLAT